jgi:hypothetical protein
MKHVGFGDVLHSLELKSSDKTNIYLRAGDKQKQQSTCLQDYHLN